MYVCVCVCAHVGLLRGEVCVCVLMCPCECVSLCLHMCVFDLFVWGFEWNEIVCVCV